MNPKYQVMPPLSDEQYDALKADIDAAGVLVPIEVDEHGEIIDGHHRKKIADELGKECPEVVIRGLQEFEKLDRAFVLNATRRHFDREQKRAVIMKSLKLHPRLADREHARRCGVSHPTVSGVRSAMEAAGQLESFTSRLGGDGRERPAHNEPTKPSIPAATSPADGPKNPPADTPPTPDVPEEPSDLARVGDAGGQPEQNHRGAAPLGVPPVVGPRVPDAGDGREPEAPTPVAPSGADAQRGQGHAGVSGPAPVPDPEKVRRNEALTSWAQDTPEHRTSARRRQYFAFLEAGEKFMAAIGPDELAGELSDEEFGDGEAFSDAFVTWLTAVDAIRKQSSRLRLVKGA